MSTQQSIVVHISTGSADDWRMALRNLVNLVNDDSVTTPPESIQVVVNGQAVRFLLAAGPEAGKVTRMAESGVDILACSNSLDRFGHAAVDLAKGVGTVPSGVAAVVRAQQGGSAYLKLP